MVAVRTLLVQIAVFLHHASRGKIVPEKEAAATKLIIAVGQSHTPNAEIEPIRIAASVQNSRLDVDS
jgi:hypothetical protein